MDFATPLAPVNVAVPSPYVSVYDWFVVTSSTVISLPEVRARVFAARVRVEASP